MIRYPKGSFLLRNIFAVHGSVFLKIAPVSVLCGALGAAFKFMQLNAVYHADWFFANVVTDNSAYSSFSVLIGFLVVFRTQTSYGRFWDSCKEVKTMQSEFWTTGANLVAFCRYPDTDAKAGDARVLHFQHVLIRLLSLLHAVCLMKLHGKEQDRGIQPIVIDAKGLDDESIKAIKDEDCKAEIIVQWIQCLTVDSVNSGVCSIPPPIMSRIFQNLSNGLTAYYNAYRVTEIPYPFPYLQATEVLLLMHYFVTPVVMCTFTTLPIWSGIFSFLITFILFSLNRIAHELEDPFGGDPNDLDLDCMQACMNKCLLLLMKPSTGRVPVLAESATLELSDSEVVHGQSTVSWNRCTTHKISECFATDDSKDVGNTIDRLCSSRKSRVTQEYMDNFERKTARRRQAIKYGALDWEASSSGLGSLSRVAILEETEAIHRKSSEGKASRSAAEPGALVGAGGQAEYPGDDPVRQSSIDCWDSPSNPESKPSQPRRRSTGSCFEPEELEPFQPPDLQDKLQDPCEPSMKQEKSIHSRPSDGSRQDHCEHVMKQEKSVHFSPPDARLELEPLQLPDLQDKLQEPCEPAIKQERSVHFSPSDGRQAERRSRAVAGKVKKKMKPSCPAEEHAPDSAPSREAFESDEHSR